MPFKGELMTCAICGKKQKSDREVGSNWTYIRLNDSGFYVCPDCLDDHPQPKNEIPGRTLRKVSRMLGRATKFTVNSLKTWLLPREGKRE